MSESKFQALRHTCAARFQIRAFQKGLAMFTKDKTKIVQPQDKPNPFSVASNKDFILTLAEFYEARCKLGIDDTLPCTQCGTKFPVDFEGQDVALHVQLTGIGAKEVRSLADETYYLECGGCGFRRHFALRPLAIASGFAEDHSKE